MEKQIRIALAGNPNSGKTTLFNWLADNLATILISGVLLLVVIAIIIYLRRRKKQGISSCGCNCANCAMHGACHQKKL